MIIRTYDVAVSSEESDVEASDVVADDGIAHGGLDAGALDTGAIGGDGGSIGEAGGSAGGPTTVFPIARVTVGSFCASDIVRAASESEFVTTDVSSKLPWLVTVDVASRVVVVEAVTLTPCASRFDAMRFSTDVDAFALCPKSNSRVTLTTALLLVFVVVCSRRRLERLTKSASHVPTIPVHEASSRSRVNAAIWAILRLPSAAVSW